MPTDVPAEPPVIAIGGYLETYYQLNVRTPDNHITNLRGFDNRDRTFTLSNAALDIKATRGALVAHVVLQIGATPSTYYLAEPALAGTGSVNASDGTLWKYLQQATLAYSVGDTVIDAGLFLSPIGPEAIAVKDNWTWSRSNLFFGLPFYHTGARVAHPLGGGWTGVLHVYSGWNSVVDNNSYPSVAASASYAGDRISGQVLYFGGVERATGAPEGAAWRHLFDAYATLTITDELAAIVHADAGVEPNDLATSGWIAGAVSARYQLTPMLHAAVRGDGFREWTGDAAPIFWPTPWIASATATLGLQPIDGLSVRLETRHDHAKTDAFFGGDVEGDGATTPFVPNRRAQDTVTLGATAWF